MAVPDRVLKQVEIRSAQATDAPFLVEMARHACVIEDWPLPEPDSEDTLSLLPGADDVKVVAVDGAGVQLGAAWTFRHEPALLVDRRGQPVPEIAIAVTPAVRDWGIGGALLDGLVDRCTGSVDALSLNVHERNPAVRLYQRKGFHALGRGRGALGIAMRKDLGFTP